MPDLTEAVAARRLERVVEMYRAGVPVADIADCLGIKAGTTHTMIYQMRKAGWNLPYRAPRDAGQTVRPPRLSG